MTSAPVVQDPADSVQTTCNPSCQLARPLLCRRQTSKGRKLALRLDEAEELFERSETLRNAFAQEHKEIALPKSGQLRTLGRYASSMSLQEVGVSMWVGGER